MRKRFDTKNPYTWVILGVWLVGTAVGFYGAHLLEWSTSPQTAGDIAWKAERFGILNPAYEPYRVVIYGAFASVVIYLVVRYLVRMVERIARKRPT